MPNLSNDVFSSVPKYTLCAFHIPQKQDSATLDMERANKEIDMLRKQCEAISQELKEALQEAEVAKCRRDWAFQERDKIVAERESIRYGAGSNVFVDHLVF